MVPTSIDPFLDPADGRNWVASSVLHGTPGADDLVATAVRDGKKRNFTPSEYHLYQNYPNPFNPSTSIKFDLPEEAHVQLGLYNIMGQQVEELIDARLSAGEHSIRWNGEAHAAGVYLYHLQAAEFGMTKKMTLIR